jgi:hypothetical protein
MILTVGEEMLGWVLRSLTLESASEAILYII